MEASQGSFRDHVHVFPLCATASPQGFIRLSLQKRDTAKPLCTAAVMIMVGYAHTRLRSILGQLCRIA
jgi:hypothetical protein